MTLAEFIASPNMTQAAGAAGGAFGAAVGQLLLNARIRKVVAKVVAERAKPLEARIAELEARNHQDLLTRLERVESKVTTP